MPGALMFPFLRGEARGCAEHAFPRGGAGIVPEPDEGRVPLRLRRHCRDDAADEDAQLGHTFMPPGIHAGGLRYHAMAPLICRLFSEGYLEARRPTARTRASRRRRCSRRRRASFRLPRSSHAIRAAIDEALAAKEAGERRTILFNLSEHGLLDLQAYDDYLAGNLVDDEYPKKVKEAMAGLPVI